MSGTAGSRELDRRAGGPDRATPRRRAELRERAAQLSATLPGSPQITIARFDPLTGNPALVRFRRTATPPVDAPGTPAPVDAAGTPPPVDAAGTPARDAAGAPPVDAAEPSPVARALEHARLLAPVLGLDPRSDLIPTGSTTASSGATAVHLSQQVLGLPVFDAGVTVRISGGLPGDVTGRVVGDEPPRRPRRRVRALAAARAALHHLASTAPTPEPDPFGSPAPPPPTDPDLSAEPQVLAGFVDRPGARVLLRAGTRTVTVEPVWFPLPDGLRPAWQVRVGAARDPGLEPGPVELVIDAGDGTVAYSGPEGALG